MNDRYSGPVTAVILDLGGTLVDGDTSDGKGDRIPVLTLQETFDSIGVDLSEGTIRSALGFSRSHLRTLLETEEGASQFRERHGQQPTAETFDDLYDEVREVLPKYITRSDLAQPIPGAKEAVDTLHRRGISVGCTTGFPEQGAEALYDYLREEFDVNIDFGCYPDMVPTGRPGPWMVLRNMRELGAYPPEAVIKVGDKTSDIAEGNNAGVWTVGVYSTGNNEAHELRDAGADFVVPSVRDVPEVVETVNRQHQSGGPP